MKFHRKIASTAVVALTLGGAGIGTAVAGSSASTAPAASVVRQDTPPEPAGPDTDNIQHGDQNAPDNERPGEHGQAETPEGADGPGGHADASAGAQHEAGSAEK